MVALAHFLADFKAAFLLEGSPTRHNIRASFSRCQHLLDALLFNWHPFEHGEDSLALSRHLRNVRSRHA